MCQVHSCRYNTAGALYMEHKTPSFQILYIYIQYIYSLNCFAFMCLYIVSLYNMFVLVAIFSLCVAASCKAQNCSKNSQSFYITKSCLDWEWSLRSLQKLCLFGYEMDQSVLGNTAVCLRIEFLCVSVCFVCVSITICVCICQEKNIWYSLWSRFINHTMKSFLWDMNKPIV